MGFFFHEFKRRNVHKVAFGYGAFGWLVVQSAITLFPLLGIGAEAAMLVAVVVALAFPPALFVAWRYEMTPHGMKRTEHVAPDEKIPQWSRQKFICLIVTATLLATALLVLHLLYPRTLSTAPEQLSEAIVLA